MANLYRPKQASCRDIGLFKLDIGFYLETKIKHLFSDNCPIINIGFWILAVSLICIRCTFFIQFNRLRSMYRIKVLID